MGGQTTWCLRDFLDLDRFTTDGGDRDPYYGMVQPRLGFAWDVQGNAKTVVFGGWGKYYDRVVLNDIFDEQYRQQYRIYSFCFSADGSPAPNCSVPALAWRPEYLSGEALRAARRQRPGPGTRGLSGRQRPAAAAIRPVDPRRAPAARQLARLALLRRARGYNGLIYFFGDLPPGTAFGDRFGNNVGVPGYARVFITSTSRRTWYDGIYLTLDQPLAAGGRWGFNLAYTYADAEQNGTDNPGEGVAFGAFDYLDPDEPLPLPRHPTTSAHRLVMSGTRRPAGQLPGLLDHHPRLRRALTIFDDS